MEKKNNNTVEYDKYSPRDIEKYAQNLIGKRFRDVYEEDSANVSNEKFSENYAEKHEDKKFKGGLGNLIEERFFHYDANSESEPDFKEAGVELKVTPYKIGKGNSLVAKERLSLTMIDYNQLINEEFEDSHLWHKCHLMLIIYYFYEKEAERLDYQIDYAKLFTPPEEDLNIIKRDFEIIRDKVRAGKAHELSESDTMYLGAATKSSDSSITRSQPNSDIPAKPRAFSFKNSYMTYVLNNYIVAGKDTCERILPKGEKQNFEEYVTAKINKYSGWKISDLYSEFNMSDNPKAKNLGALVAYRILGIKGNKAEEFEKANIVVKTIRIGKNGKIKENMSFPSFEFKELIKEDWENSTFGNYLRETKFLFIVYKYDQNDELRLMGCQFWNIPYSDLENEVRGVWERTKEVLINGLEICYKNGKAYNNFPKQSENRISHVRPHAKDSSDTYELPDGRNYPKQCFWLNNSYILSQLDNRFKC